MMLPLPTQTCGLARTASLEASQSSPWKLACPGIGSLLTACQALTSTWKSSEVNGSHPGSFAVFIDSESTLATKEKMNLEEERERSLLRAARGRNRKLLTSGFN